MAAPASAAVSQPSTGTPVTTMAKSILTLPFTLLRHGATDPLVTGSLLLALTRAPAQYRSRVLDFLSSRVGVSAATAITTLKCLFALGLVRRVNQALTRLAYNNYQLIGKPGAPFQWATQYGKKEELVVVTGGCSGFGFEMVKGFAKIARVVCLDITPLPAELERIPDVYYYQIDLTDFEAIERVAEQIRREHGNPSVLVNNAGIGTGEKLHTATPKMVDRIFKVNLSSHFILIKEFLPGMLAQRKGHVVTIASMASFLSAPGLVDYCCTKVGALYLTEGLRNELRAFHGPAGKCIQTTSVHPFWHATGIVAPYAARLARAGVKMDPASNVSDAVVEQVVAGRSGQIFMPRSQASRAGLRNLPVWVQDFLLARDRKKVSLE